LIRNMGRLGVETLCYNWMPADDWSRTSVSVKERGGALVTEWNEAAVDGSGVVLSGQKLSDHVTPPEQLWDNLKYFLTQVRRERGCSAARCSTLIQLMKCVFSLTRCFPWLKRIG
jgi:D-mannonate dehydratase